jgi:hypothetical protein
MAGMGMAGDYFRMTWPAEITYFFPAGGGGKVMGSFLANSSNVLGGAWVYRT